MLCHDFQRVISWNLRHTANYAFEITRFHLRPRKKLRERKRVFSYAQSVLYLPDIIKLLGLGSRSGAASYKTQQLVRMYE